MGQVTDFFKKLFDTSDFPPRWHCGHWSDFHGWLYIISDLMIWSAYFAIPLIIIRYITRKQDARFIRIYVLFASFILACGSTHLLDAIIFWVPVYRFSALIRLFTGIISWITVFSLIKLLPIAFTLKTSQQLEEEVRQKEEAERKLQVNIELLNEAQEIAKTGHWEWDVLNDTIIWSKTMRKIYGVAPDENITYSRYIGLIHPDDRDYVQGSVRAAIENKKFSEYYHRSMLDDGTVKTMHSKGEVVVGTDGRVLKMIGTGQDVTKQKKVEQELLLKSQELEDINDELQKFASIASHDLREPLRKIITFASMLEKEVDGSISDNGKMYLEKITSASSRMQKMIDDILDFSRFSNTGYSFNYINLNTIINEVITDMEVLIQSTGGKITIDNLPDIEANPGLLGRMFQNLISNALKFSKEGQPPTIHISSEILTSAQLSKNIINDKTDNRFSILNNPVYWDNERFCKISIKDNGIGFDEHYLDKIFLIFQRLHGRTTYDGTGIGLAVCKKVTDIHHGILTAESKPGEGATFIVILPVSQRKFRV
jgi:PAS domain S-box-containing protein